MIRLPRSPMQAVASGESEREHRKNHNQPARELSAACRNLNKLRARGVAVAAKLAVGTEDEFEFVDRGGKEPHRRSLWAMSRIEKESVQKICRFLKAHPHPLLPRDRPLRTRATRRNCGGSESSANQWISPVRYRQVDPPRTFSVISIGSPEMDATSSASLRPDSRRLTHQGKGYRGGASSLSTTGIARTDRTNNKAFDEESGRLHESIRP